MPWRVRGPSERGGTIARSLTEGTALRVPGMTMPGLLYAEGNVERNAVVSDGGDTFFAEIFCKPEVLCSAPISGNADDDGNGCNGGDGGSA